MIVEHRSLPLCFDFLPDGTLIVVSNSEFALLRLGPEWRTVVVCPPRFVLIAGIERHRHRRPRQRLRELAQLRLRGRIPARRSCARTAWCLVPADGTARIVAEDLAFPNGMAVSADNRTLVIAESYRCQLTAFDIAEDGSLSGRRTFAELGEDPPDGICFDAEGAIWYADVPHKHCVRVREGGDLLDVVEFDRGAFACILGGPVPTGRPSTQSGRAGPVLPV